MTSVIIIGKDESKNIIDCISSIRVALKEHDHEIIYIDSNSQDNSAQLAAQQGARTYILKEKNSTAALGRFIGTKLSKGEFILFLDSDMRLCNGFVEEALHIMLSQNFDGACGIRDDIYYKDDVVCHQIKNYYNLSIIQKARFFGGAIFIRKSVLEKVGGWAPSVSTCEEAELHARLNKFKASIVEIPFPMIIHYDRNTYVRNIKDIIITKRRIGIGEAFKNAFKSRSLFYFLIREKAVFSCIALDLLSILLIYPLIISISWNSIFVLLSIQLFQIILLCIFKTPKSYITAKLSIVYLPIGIFSYEKKSLEYEEVIFR